MNRLKAVSGTLLVVLGFSKNESCIYYAEAYSFAYQQFEEFISEISYLKVLHQ